MPDQVSSLRMWGDHMGQLTGLCDDWADGDTPRGA